MFNFKYAKAIRLQSYWLSFRTLSTMSVLLLKVIYSIATFSCFSAPEVSGEHFVDSNDNLIPDNETKISVNLKNSKFGAFIFVSQIRNS